MSKFRGRVMSGQTSSVRYDWRRFWRPYTRSESRSRPSTNEDATSWLESLDEDGFLYDPESKYGTLRNPGVAQLDSFADTPCLILLGEPGMGKTTTMQDDSRRLQSLVAGLGDRVILK